MSDMTIRQVLGRSVWDSRGRPTVEVEVHLEGGGSGRAIAPSGASTGSGEALDRRDGGSRLGGYGVDAAVAAVNTQIRAALIGRDAGDQEGVDQCLVTLDGTGNRQVLGGNAMIATSMAVAHAAAAGSGQPLWRYLGERTLAGEEPCTLPVPEVQIFGGGAHAEGCIDLQDFMVVPFGAGSFREAMEWTAEVYRAAGSLMDRRGRRCGVADEGGYWPAFDSNEEAIAALATAVEDAGFSTEKEVGLSLDIAATQFYREGRYCLGKDRRTLDVGQWYEQLARWLSEFPICMIEDPFHESDLANHAALTEAFGDRVQIVGDDLCVTHTDNILACQRQRACNTLLCKPNQVGTLSEALAAHQMAKEFGWNTVVSARSGETEDVTIVHLALGWGIQQLKVGSFARSERMAKWNEALRIEEALGNKARYAGRAPFAR
ncbi:phosphopyruvate hydratase [Parahaliea maris]|uniref:Enolase n=1 Tax=Parahaliea maris TaxID=2716870 RepID=A0A5C8ZP50_9GAMM|nr:phosphopyruvate hydratase [Parahaliea maris]TXS89512.1 phosphopyruvate hydratase [Parahaliea maris]